jgi:hypothetical protein
MKKDYRTLPITLTDHEIETYGRELATCLVNAARLAEQRKALNSAIKELDTRATELSEAIDSGQELREVACSWSYDWAIDTKTLYREDTGEVVENGLIPEHERQTHFQ